MSNNKSFELKLCDEDEEDEEEEEELGLKDE